MSSIDIDMAKKTLHEIALQAYNLAMGLQNAAPSQASPGPSIQYLKEISIQLESISKQIDALK
jgi:hypothetical protein